MTDDTEMAVSLALGLLETIGKYGRNFEMKNVNNEFIGFYYYYWLKSNPFDIGQTTYKALNIKYGDNFMTNSNFDKIALYMESNAEQFNKESLSNGFLMRHTPITVFLYYIGEINNGNILSFDIKKSIIDKENYDDLFHFLNDFIHNEIRLTHYDRECKFAAITYDFLILNILYLKDLNKDISSLNPSFYLEILKEFFEKILNSSDHNIFYYKKFSYDLLNLLQKIMKIPDLDQLNQNEITDIISSKTMGYYLHSITLIFISLKFYNNFIDENNGIYKNIMSYICNMGGDTDTNCCIVGGVIGALIGINNIQNTYTETHLKFNPTIKNIKHRRYFIYAPSILTFYGIKLFSVLDQKFIRDDKNTLNNR